MKMIYKLAASAILAAIIGVGAIGCEREDYTNMFVKNTGLDPVHIQGIQIPNDGKPRKVLRMDVPFEDVKFKIERNGAAVATLHLTYFILPENWLSSSSDVFFTDLMVVLSETPYGKFYVLAHPSAVWPGDVLEAWITYP